jgi:thiol-disulfide isomerase/thioredoxin
MFPSKPAHAPGVSLSAWYLCSVVCVLLLLASASAAATGSLRTLDGHAAAVPAGKALLLQFWASWCNSCGGLLWDLDRIAGDFESVHYLAVGIDADPVDARRITGHPLHERHPARFVLDSAGALADRFAIRVTPSLVVLDADGAVAWRHVGHVNADDLIRLRGILSTLHSVPLP